MARFNSVDKRFIHIHFDFKRIHIDYGTDTSCGKATVRVRIRFLEKDERVLPDMGIRVSFLQKMAETTTEKKEGVVVPNAAVLSQGDNSYVMLVRNGRIEVKLVEVAEETPNYSRIIKGVRAGDQVVASYDQDLENNQKVSIN